MKAKFKSYLKYLKEVLGILRFLYAPPGLIKIHYYIAVYFLNPLGGVLRAVVMIVGLIIHPFIDVNSKTGLFLIAIINGLLFYLFGYSIEKAFVLKGRKKWLLYRL